MSDYEAGWKEGYAAATSVQEKKEVVDVFEDIKKMHEKFGVHDWVSKELQMHRDWMRLEKFLQFRLNFLTEELDETVSAYKNSDKEEIVDGLIDLIVVAVGTLDAFGVDGRKAWNEVLKANMSKEVGVKESRPNPLGLPDLIKPHDWSAPEHKGNTGHL